MEEPHKAGAGAAARQAGDHDPDALGALLDRETRRRLHELDPVAVCVAVSATLLGLVLSFSIALWSASAWGYGLAFVSAIAVQTHMAVLMHEAAHGLVARDRARNDRVSNWLFVYPIGMTLARYRQNHLPHHSALGTPGDPDFTQICIPPMQNGLASSIRGCLFGLRHVQLLKKFARGAVDLVAARAQQQHEATVLGSSVSYGEVERAGSDARDPILAHCGPVESFIGRALWQCSLLGVCAVAGQPEFYLWGWILPLFTFGVLVNELRTIAEHTPLVSAHERPSSPEHPSVVLAPITRTVRPGFVGRYWVGVLNFHLHHEHHRLAGVPFSRLPEFHRILVGKGYYDRHPELLSQGYGAILRQVARLYRNSPCAVAIERGRYVVRRA